MSRDSEMEEFAGFTRGEWLAAMTGAMGKRGADSYVRALFSRIAEVPSNGFALAPDTWARLALVSPSCDARVTAATSDYPDEVRRQIEEHKASFRRA